MSTRKTSQASIAAIAAASTDDMVATLKPASKEQANKLAAQANANDALYAATYGNAKSDATMCEAFIAAGGDQAGPKHILMSARVAFALGVTREAALRVMAKKGNPGKRTDVGDDTRTTEEEKACGAARTFLSGRLKAWGIKTTETRGGDRDSDKRANTMDTEKLVLPKKPVVQTSVELSAYALAYAKAGYDFFLLNKAHKAVASGAGPELMGLFADFVASIEDVINEHKA